jgi:hypothetical protein
MAERLQALQDGEIPNLLMLVPPGMAKSLVASVLYPCWAWARDPSERFLCSAHAQTISVRDTVRGRNVLRSPWYRALWPHVRLVDDQDTKARYTNTAGGWRVATSTGSQVTGERASTIIVDDPVDLMAAYHPEQIARAVDHYNTALTSRGTGERTKRVIVAQRVAYRDLASEVLEQMDRGGEPFDVLLLPMRYSATFQMVLPSGRAIGADQLRHDERRPGGAREGEELLFPELYPEHVVSRLEVAYADRAEAILQQAPTQHQGQVFRRSTFRQFLRRRRRPGREPGVPVSRRREVPVTQLPRARLREVHHRGPRREHQRDGGLLRGPDMGRHAGLSPASCWIRSGGGTRGRTSRGPVDDVSPLEAVDGLRGVQRLPAHPRATPGAGGHARKEGARGPRQAGAGVGGATLMAEGRVYFRAYPRADWLGDLEDELASFPVGRTTTR